jgi:hypothetical protein
MMAFGGGGVVALKSLLICAVRFLGLVIFHNISVHHSTSRKIRVQNSSTLHYERNVTKQTHPNTEQNKESIKFVLNQY